MKAALILFGLLFSSIVFAQNPSIRNTSLSSNDRNILYRGFENIITVDKDVSDNNSYALKGINCSVTKMNNKGKQVAKNTFIVKPGRGDQAIVSLVETRSGTVMNKTTFEIHNLPAPALCLDNIPAGSKIHRNVKRIIVRYPPGVPLSTRFRTIRWEVNIKGQVFKANGSVLSPEVSKRIKSMPPGTKIVITAVIQGPDSVARKVAGEFLL